MTRTQLRTIRDALLSEASQAMKSSDSTDAGFIIKMVTENILMGISVALGEAVKVDPHAE